MVPIQDTAAHSALAASIAAAASFKTTQLGAQKLSSRVFPESMFATALAVMCTDTGKLMKYRELLTHRDPTVSRDWKTSSANEFRRLITKTKTCRFVSKGDVPLDRFKDVTYGKFECSVRPQKKDEPLRTRLVMGGN